MTGDEVRTVMNRIHGLWPRERDEETDREWVVVLKPLEYRLADAAVDELRDTVMFPPSVAEFRSAYYSALATVPTPALALPPGDEEPTDFADLYGENAKQWVYCWRCDMALTLEERGSAKFTGYDGTRGFYHRRCPKHGSAPAIPSGERMERDEYFARRKILIGRSAEPLPYRGG